CGLSPGEVQGAVVQPARRPAHFLPVLTHELIPLPGVRRFGRTRYVGCIPVRGRRTSPAFSGLRFRDATSFRPSAARFMKSTKAVTRGLALAGAGAACGAAAGCLVGAVFGLLLLAACGKVSGVLNAGLYWAATGALAGATLGAVGSLDEEGFVA